MLTEETKSVPQFLSRIRKEPRFNDPMIEDFIRADKCLTCGAQPPSTVSHTARRGRSGNNASILRAIPQCMDCHRLYETNQMEIDEKLIELYREKVVAYLCQTIRDLRGEVKHTPRSAPVRQKPKGDELVKKSRDKYSKRVTCKFCFMKYFPGAEQHTAECRRPK